jgi:hypothetical protein
MSPATPILDRLIASATGFVLGATAMAVLVSIARLLMHAIV